MGYAISFQCKCQSGALWVGVGMNYHGVYQHVLQEIKKGQYGQKMKDLVLNDPYIVVDATLAPFICDKCGHVETAMPLDLYKPKPGELQKIKKRIITRWSAADPAIDKTVEELGGFPYWTPDDDDNDFTIVEERLHFCPNCGNTMKKTTVDKIFETKCPACKEKYSRVPGILDMPWD